MAKTALCIGINNYPGTQMDLHGCVNDAQDWAAVLTERGFSVTLLLDDKATKQAMVEGFERVVTGASKGDSVVITYSGHGTYVPDLNGEEADGLDEALCPYDLRTGGAFIDDEIHAIFAKRAPGVRLVLISDSCHSGTVTRAVATEPDDGGPRPRFMPMGNWLDAARLPRGASGAPLTRVAQVAGTSAFAKATSRASGDLLLAGCQEGSNHYSYDARMAGRPNGAFTYYALKALEDLPADATYADWHAAITPAFLPSSSYPQTPQIVANAAARRRRVLS